MQVTKSCLSYLASVLPPTVLAASSVPALESFKHAVAPIVTKP